MLNRLRNIKKGWVRDMVFRDLDIIEWGKLVVNNNVSDY